MIDVLVVIPFRDRGDPERVANLQYVRQHIETATPYDFITVSDGYDNPAIPFNRSAAYNRAISEHPGRAVYIFHEADMLIPPANYEAAVAKAYHSSRFGMVVPFNIYRYLSASVTDLVRSGLADPFTAPHEWEMLHGRATGALNVVSRETLSAVGQFDPVFSGWGYDDRAMTRAFAVATGRMTRYVEGPGVHLHHMPGWQAGGKFVGGAAYMPQIDAAATAANKHRYELYVKATTARRIRELTAGALT